MKLPYGSMLRYNADKKKLELYIDSSILLNSSCDKDFLFTNLIGLRSTSEKPYSHYGQAFHHAVAMHLNGAKKSDIIKDTVEYFEGRAGALDVQDDWRDTVHLMGTVGKYLNEYKNEPFRPYQRADGGLMVEVYAASLYYESSDIDVYFACVLDALGLMGDMACLKDVKTTATVHSKNQMDKFFKNYEKSFQMYFYSFMCKRLGYFDYYPPVIIDGVFLKNDDKPCSLKRSHIIEIDPETMDFMLEFATQRVKHLVDAIRSNNMMRDPSQCDRRYGGCAFKSICWGDPRLKLANLQGFKQTCYNPEDFGTFQLSEIKDLEEFKHYLTHA